MLTLTGETGENRNDGDIERVRSKGVDAAQNDDHDDDIRLLFII